MQRNTVEILIGTLVLIVAAVFVGYSYTASDKTTKDGFIVTAQFNSVSGIRMGSPVRMSGVPIGSVTDVTLDPETYFALLTLSLDPSIKIPSDSVLKIVSEGLLGGNYLSLEPGVEEEYIEANGKLLYTEIAPDLQQLLGQVVFGLQNVGKTADKTDGAAEEHSSLNSPAQDMSEDDTYSATDNEIATPPESTTIDQIDTETDENVDALYEDVMENDVSKPDSEAVSPDALPPDTLSIDKALESNSIIKDFPADTDSAPPVTEPKTPESNSSEAEAPESELNVPETEVLLKRPQKLQ